MCILFIKLLKAAKPGEFKLILASNRDELFKRPGKCAHFWEEDGSIIGGMLTLTYSGRDMTEKKQGGTWLAMSKKGKLGVLLNLTGENAVPQKLGRGFLIADYLKCPLNEKEYLQKIMQNGHDYNKFHLITAVLGPNPNLFHYSNGDNTITKIESETFAISNSSLKKPFRKVINGKKRFDEICAKYPGADKKEELVQELLSFLKWEEKHYPDDVISSLNHLTPDFKLKYSAIFVNAPEFSYGTRTHTIVLVDWKNRVEFYEWTLQDPINSRHMEWKQTVEKFDLSFDAPSDQI